MNRKISRLNIIDTSIRHIVENIYKGIKSGELEELQNLSHKEIEKIAKAAQGSLSVIAEMVDELAMVQLREKKKSTDEKSL